MDKLYCAIKNFCVTDSNLKASIYPRSYNYWTMEIQGLEELRLDLTTDNPDRAHLLNVVMWDLSHNRWCAGQANNPELTEEKRRWMAMAERDWCLPANIECFDLVLNGRGAVA